MIQAFPRILESPQWASREHLKRGLTVGHTGVSP